MKENEFLKIIGQTLDDFSFLGDDCAYLKNENIFLTQDNLVENVHFSLDYTTPFKLGVKSVEVNISDLAAAFAKPLYLSIGLALPEKISEDFVREFYEGINFACKKYGCKVTGGDITSSEKIFISICAIGKNTLNYSVSKKNIQPGDLIFTTGSYGASAAGLFALRNNIENDVLVNAHLLPRAKVFEVQSLTTFINRDITATDTSDGLADALWKLALSSKINLEINNIPVCEEVLSFGEKYGLNIENTVLWGGEDYEIILAIPPDIAEKADMKGFTLIGKALEKSAVPSVKIDFRGKRFCLDEKMYETHAFNHFKGSEND